MKSGRVLLVDFNNFARYPTVAIGYLTSVLREAEFDVRVFSPFAKGIEGTTREPAPPVWGRAQQRLRYRTAMVRTPLVRRLRSISARRALSALSRKRTRVMRDLEQHLDVDVVLVSSYLMYYSHCRDLAEACAQRGIPMILGSQYFSVPEVTSAFRELPGVTAVVAGEVESHLATLVTAAIDGEQLDRFPGVLGNGTSAAPPLRELDALPFPDYDDFPWDSYPNRIIPVITGRGCGWGVCNFCSDIITGAGRTYRSRSPENVLAEVAYQAKRYETHLFAFTDLKLNSSPQVWNALSGDMRTHAPGARWIGAVHVDPRDRTLDYDRLLDARRNGCVRLTTGLESASQPILDRFAKGTDVASSSKFLRDARRAGISVRTTLIVGAPGERVEDVDATRRFLEAHVDCVERVRLNRLNIMLGTKLHGELTNEPQSFPDLEVVEQDPRSGTLDHLDLKSRDKAYVKSVYDLIEVTHAINSRPIQSDARDFEGVM